MLLLLLLVRLLPPPPSPALSRKEDRVAVGSEAKGNAVLIPQPGPDTNAVAGRPLSDGSAYPATEPGNGNQLSSAGGGPGKSFLFCLRRRDPGSHSL